MRKMGEATRARRSAGPNQRRRVAENLRGIERREILNRRYNDYPNRGPARADEKGRESQEHDQRLNYQVSRVRQL